MSVRKSAASARRHAAPAAANRRRGQASSIPNGQGRDIFARRRQGRPAARLPTVRRKLGQSRSACPPSRARRCLRGRSDRRRCAAAAARGSGGSASRTETSPAYPPSCPDSSARTIASRSQILPRAVLMRYAPRFILPNNVSLNMCSVSGCNGALIVTTSHTDTSDSTVSWYVTPSSSSASRGSRWRSV